MEIIEELLMDDLFPAEDDLLKEAWPHFAAVTLAEAGTSLDL